MQALHTHVAPSYAWGGTFAVREIVLQEVLVGAQKHGEGNDPPMQALEHVLMGPLSDAARVHQAVNLLKLMTLL